MGWCGELPKMTETALFRVVRYTEIDKEEYPRRLRTIVSPPEGLYYSGDIRIANQRQGIAVVGSRRVSKSGTEMAYHIGYALGKKGFNVVNGLALGCDTHALCGALAAGAACVAVLPCGLERVVPHSNRGLAQRIVSGGGCLVSEYPPSAPAQRYQYVHRDRIQSGLCGGVIVIEAAIDSGTMHTVRYAMRQGRLLACVDSRLVQDASGNQWMERQGGVRVIRDTEDLDLFLAKVQRPPACRQIRMEDGI